MKKIACLIIGFAVLLALLSGCRYNFSSGFDFGGLVGKNIQTGETSMDGSGLSEIEVNNGAGIITITKSSAKDVELSYRKEVKGSSENAKEVLEKISVDSEINGDKLIIKVNTTDDSAQDFWSWLSSKYSSINVTVDLDIKVPENIEIFRVSNGVGDIYISNLDGRFDIEGGVGSINVRNVHFAGECEFGNGTGSIDLDCDISNAENLTAQTGVGEINIRLPNDSKFSLDAATGVGNIKGNLIEPSKKSFVGDNLKQDVNGGGTKLELTTGTGSITINKK